MLSVVAPLNYDAKKFYDLLGRLITIFCDLISCFMGYGNKTPLTEYPYVKGSFPGPVANFIKLFKA